MTETQVMISTDMMTLTEQMELGLVTKSEWPMPLEQLTKEEVVELGFATTAICAPLESSQEMKSFWEDVLADAYNVPAPKSWADKVEEEVVGW